jgi:hypothetical protein
MFSMMVMVPIMILTHRELPKYLRRLLRRANSLDDERLDVRRFSIAGLRLKLRFTNRGLADLYSERLIGRSATDGEPADLRVDVLETAPLGWPLPQSWGEFEYAAEWLEQNLVAEGLRAAYPYQAQLWQVYDEHAQAALQLTGYPSDLPIWDSGAPLRHFIHWAMARRGSRLLHGATLGKGSDGVLISGPGGIGKSGTALAGIVHGLNTVGDDYVVVEHGDSPIARPVYRMFKQDLEGLGRLSASRQRLAGRLVNWQGKLEFDPEELSPGCMVRCLRLRAILIPSIARLPASRLQPISRDQAIEAITRSTVVQLAGDRASTALFCTALTARLPVFQFQLSEEPSEVAATVARLIEELAQ